jgi:hypothetical protein
MTKEEAFKKFIEQQVHEHGSSSRDMPAVRLLQRGFAGGWEAHSELSLDDEHLTTEEILERRG